MSFATNHEQIYKMIFCYLISPDTAKFNKLKHLIFIFYQNNFAVVVYKDISMISLSSRASFIKNTQKNILTITLGICLVLTVLLANVIESQNFHIQRVFFYLPMLGLVVNIFGNILSTISQTVQAFLAQHMFYVPKPGMALHIKWTQLSQVLH